MCFERRNHVLVGRSRQHRAPDDHDVIRGFVFERIADLFADTDQVAEIEAAVLAARRADANERQVGISDGLGRARRRPQTMRIDAFLEQRIETRLDDRTPAGVDGGDFLWIHIDADDVMSIGGKVRRGNASDVAEAEYRNSHSVSFRLYKAERLDSRIAESRVPNPESRTGSVNDCTPSPSIKVRYQSSRFSSAQIASPPATCPSRWASRRCSTAGASTRPRSRVRRSSSTSRTTGCHRPRVHSPNGTGKPIFLRVRISSGSSPRTASRRMRLVVKRRSLSR